MVKQSISLYYFLQSRWFAVGCSLCTCHRDLFIKHNLVECTIHFPRGPFIIITFDVDIGSLSYLALRSLAFYLSKAYLYIKYINYSMGAGKHCRILSMFTDKEATWYYFSN